MAKRVKITIEVREDIDSYVADILCWLAGYREGKRENEYHFLDEAIEKVKDLNLDIKRKLRESENKDETQSQ